MGEVDINNKTKISEITSDKVEKTDDNIEVEIVIDKIEELDTNNKTEIPEITSDKVEISDNIDINKDVEIKVKDSHSSSSSSSHSGSGSSSKKKVKEDIESDIKTDENIEVKVVSDKIEELDTNI